MASLAEILEGGQRRRQWLDEKINKGLRYYLGPTGISDRLGAMGELLNPVVGIEQAGSHARDLTAPERSVGERLSSGVGAATETLGALLPVAGGRIAAQAGAGADDAAKAITDALTGMSAGAATSAARGVAHNARQPSANPRTTLYSGGPVAPTADLPRFPPRYSPSLRAAEGLKQNKGSIEQMRAMLLKGGGKEDELAWAGFDEAFPAGSKANKSEIVEYLRRNTDMIDDLSDTAEGKLGSGDRLDFDSLVDRYVADGLDEEAEHVMTDWLPEQLAGEAYRVRELDGEQLSDLMRARGHNPADEDAVDEFLSVHENSWLSDTSNMETAELFKTDEEAVSWFWGEEAAREMAEESLRDQAQSMDVIELRDRLGLPSGADTDDVQYHDYFIPGAKDYTETRYTFTDPANVRAEERSFLGHEGGHWDDDDVVAHARTGLFPTTDGRTAYHVGEIQSDWGQKARRSDARIATPAEESAVARGVEASSEIHELEGIASRMIADAAAAAGSIRDRARNNEMPWVNRYRRTPDGREFERAKLHRPAAARFLENSAPPEGGLPLGYNSPDQRLAQEWADNYGPRYRAAFATKEAAEPIIDNTFVGGPYVDNTPKWADMVLREQLVSAVGDGADYFTVPNSETVRRMTGGTGDGQGGFYDNIIPKRMQNLLRKYDKKARLQPMQIVGEDGNRDVYGYRMTPEFRDTVRRKGVPLWALLATGAGANAFARDERQPTLQEVLGGI